MRQRDAGAHDESLGAKNHHRIETAEVYFGLGKLAPHGRELRRIRAAVDEREALAAACEIAGAGEPGLTKTNDEIGRGAPGRGRGGGGGRRGRRRRRGGGRARPTSTS